jgi:hypothetical protein
VTVELKTNKVIDSEKADHIFHKKLLKHWAQSFLLGVPVRFRFRFSFRFLLSSISALSFADTHR